MASTVQSRQYFWPFMLLRRNEMTDAKTLNELRKEAIKYAEAGWCVLPLADYRKEPSSFLGKWEKYKKEKPTFDEINKWFSNPRVTGVAVVCGTHSNVMAIDDDSYKTGNSLPIHSTLETQTASGGRHILFQHNTQIGNRNIRTPQHEFEIQSQDRLIVLPPSRAKNKKQEIGTYKWLVGDSESLSAIEPLPRVIVEEYSNNTERPKLHELVGASLGTQHHNLRDLTHIILGRFPRNDWEIAFDVIRSLASQFDPPHPPDRVEKMIEDCVGFRNRLNVPSVGDAGYTKERDLTNDFPLDGRQSNQTMTVDFEPVLLSDITEDKLQVEWIWEGFIAEGVTTLMTARPKTGKTTLISQMLKEIENGGELAGMSINPTKVLILTEESEAKWGERREKFKLPGKSIHIVSRPMNKKYTNTEWVAALDRAAKICEENEIKLCVIDTLTTFWDAQDENDAAKVSRSLLPVFQLAKKNIGVLIVHHDRKSGGDYGNAARGSNALTGFVDIIVEVGRLDDNQSPTRRVLKTLSRFDESPSEVVIDLVDGKYVTLGDKTEVNKQQKLDTLVNCLALIGKGVTISEIFDNWDEDNFGKKPSRSTLQRHLAELIKLDRVTVISETVVGRKKTPIYGLNNMQYQKSDIDV